MESSRLEAVPPGTVHLDTVRALHQTVVSLRTALEISKSELKELKEKYEKHSQCSEYADVIEKLALENHILRRKVIDTNYNDQGGPKLDRNIKLELTYSPRSRKETENVSSSEVVIKTVTPDINSELIELKESISAVSEDEDNQSCSTEKLSERISEKSEPVIDIKTESLSAIDDTQVEETSSQVNITKQEYTLNSHSNFKTKLELLSKFDVKIKVKTIKEGAIISDTTSETDSMAEDKDKTTYCEQEKIKPNNTTFEEKKEHCGVSINNNIKIKSVSSENIKMAVPNDTETKSKTDKFDVQVRITSEDNLVVKEGYEFYEKSRRKDTLNLEVDDLSYRSMSEGDNSVFSDNGLTPSENAGRGSGMDAQQYEQGDASGNESEEVDDIELIFTTDESKDMSNLQEDLVSIRDAEQWVPSPTTTTHSTPVLIKFHTLDPDFQPGGETKDNFENENQENTCLQGVIAESSLKTKRVSLPSDKEIRHVAFNGKSLDLPGRGILKSCDNKFDNMLFRRSPNTSSRRLDSVDSLTCEYNRNLSLDNTKSSSFEMGSSMDMLQRDESVDSFHKPHLGHRFSVFAETDISKCGISEDDLSANLNIRRNTCPNPFQYRPLYRYSRPGPLKAPVSTGRARPILRDGHSVRRENGAQTDVSAIPPRWSSDGYLAHKVGLPANLPTLPSRPPRAPAPRPAPPPRPDHTRRQLLSDIGFTSMVPELSRSADPVWTLGQRCNCGDQAPTSTSKFLSRGPSYRSPCLSIDRSNEWTPQNSYTSPSAKVSGRAWRSSLPDVRGDDTDELLECAETFLRRSVDNLRETAYDSESALSRPYIPAEPRHLRLGHALKVITPHGRIAVGRVRYVGLAGGTTDSSVMVGCIFPIATHQYLPLNDGTYRGRRYFHAPPRHTALFTPFSKVVMAWAN